MRGENGQSTVEYAVLTFFVMTAVVGTFAMVEKAFRFFCFYVVGMVGLPVP